MLSSCIWATGTLLKPGPLSDTTCVQHPSSSCIILPVGSLETTEIQARNCHQKVPLVSVMQISEFFL